MTLPINWNIKLTRAQMTAPQNLFVVIGYLFGLSLVFANPPFHSNDEDRHFYNSYFLSTGQIRPIQHENQIGGYLPYNLYQVSAAYQGIPFDRGAKINPARLRELKAVPLNEASKIFYDYSSSQTNPIPYIPFAIGIRIAKAVNSNPVHLLWGARIAGLIAFLSIVFFAIKIMPVHKFVLFALALNPMTMFQAASVTYDSLSISLSFLIIALVLKYAFQEKQIRTGDIALFLFVATLQCFAKPGYFLVPFLFFIIPRRNIGSLKKSLAVFICLVIVGFLPSLTWGAYLSSLHLRGGKIFSNDFLYGSKEQWKSFASAPTDAVVHFLLNFIAQGKEWIIGSLGRLGYSYTHLNHTVLFIHGLVLIALSVFDASPDASPDASASKTITISLRQKLLIGCIAFGTIGTIAAEFFLYSPVGAHTIFGLQGRYFIPILPLLLLLNSAPRFWTAFWDKWKVLAVPLYASALLGYTVVFIHNHFY
jgi:uncharacterized membrane protein